MALRPLIIDIDVVKEGSHNGWLIEPSGCLRIAHKEPASRAANEFVIKSLAEALHISHGHISIVHGVEERKKRVKIGKDVTKEELIELLGAQQIHK